MSPITTALTLTAYAKRRGVSTVAVSKAVASGRLNESVVRDDKGVPRVVDPDLADREWEANTRHRIDREIRQGTPPPQQSGDENSSNLIVDAGASPAPDTIPDYNTSRARREAAAARREAILADMAQLDLDERRGELVQADKAEADKVADYTTVRARMMGIPSRIAQRLPHLAAEIVPIAEELIREGLEELSIDGDDP